MRQGDDVERKAGARTASDKPVAQKRKRSGAKNEVINRPGKTSTSIIHNIKAKVKATDEVSDNGIEIAQVKRNLQKKMAQKVPIQHDEERQDVAESHNHRKFISLSVNNAEMIYKLFKGGIPDNVDSNVDSNDDDESTEAHVIFENPGRGKSLTRSYAIANLRPVESKDDHDPHTELGGKTDTSVDTDIDDDETPKKKIKIKKYQ